MPIKGNDMYGKRPDATDSIDEFERQLQERTKPEPAEEPTVPQLTDRMKKNLAAEQAAGRKAVARAEKELAQRPVAKPDPVKEGTTVPVFQPRDKVPNFNEGHTKAKTLDAGN